MTMTPFVDRLRQGCCDVKSLLCVGLDPNLDAMPVGDVSEFNRAIVDATADLVCAYKPNLAFYEALGPNGLSALVDTVGHIRDCAPHAIIIGDCKRGDIDSSATAYASAMFDVWGFDAVTVNPWGGMDTVQPWLTDPRRGAFIWCRGSNAGAADLQDVEVPDGRGGGEPLYLRLARQTRLLSGGGNLGLVLGATAPEQLTAVRQVCPDMPLLIPGVGAQGGELAAAVRGGVDANGRLAIINSSRGIIYASGGSDYADAARAAAGRLRNDINQVLDEVGLGWP
jgi:orotidine-5'-phosphate decarboxylase